MLASHRVWDTLHRSVARFIPLVRFVIEVGVPSDKFVVQPNFADPDPNERNGPAEYAAYIDRLTVGRASIVSEHSPRIYPV